jgi:hypothetical protein
VSAIHVRHASRNIAVAASVSTTTFMLSRYRKSCLPRPQSSFGHTVRRLTVPPDVEALLLTELGRVG